MDFAWTGGLGIACMVQLLSAVVLLYIYIGWPGFVGKKKREGKRKDERRREGKKKKWL